MKNVQINYSLTNEDAKVPIYAKEGDAGCDLFSTEDVYLTPGETKVIPTGLRVEIPQGYEIQIRPRSGISLKTSLILPNSPGTIDSGYRGEVGVILRNNNPDILSYLGKDDSCYDEVNLQELFNKKVSHKTSDIVVYYIPKGTKIAQMVVSQVSQANFTPKDQLSTTDRGDGGYGSSNI